MSAFHHKLIVDEFRDNGGTLTVPQLAAAVGRLWAKDISEMRKLGYLIVEDAAGLWHLDLEALPDLDAGRAGDDRCPTSAPDDRGVSAPVTGSPGTDTDPQVEGETLALPLDDERTRPASPYDPRVEAA